MATADEAAQQPFLATQEANLALSDHWRGLRRSATFVAVISAPAAFLWAWQHTGLSLGWAIVVTAIVALAFRGALDLLFRKFIPWPSLFATEDMRLRDEDVLNRRRAWYWRQKYRLAAAIVLLFVSVWFVELIFGHHSTPWAIAGHFFSALGGFAKNPQYLTLFVQLPIFFLFNFLIFMGPMMLMGISQIRGFEPGVRVFVWPWFFRLPYFDRFDGHAAWNAIILREPVGRAGDDLLTHELCHVWQMQHKPLRMPLSYLRGYSKNPHELEARHAVEITRAS